PTFLTAPAPPEIYTLSLHDALPICELTRKHLSERFSGCLWCTWVNSRKGWPGAGVWEGSPGHGPNARRTSTNGGCGTVTLTICGDRKSTRLNSSHVSISYAVFCLKK